MRSPIPSRIFFLVLFISMLLLAACAQLPNVPAPNPPDAGPTAPFQPTVPQRTLFPTPTSPPNETATSAPVVAVTPTTPQTIAPRPSATATAPNFTLSGVFATAIRMRPEKPVSGGDPITFYVTFINTTGKPFTFKWRVKIWNPDDQRNSFGDTTILTSEIQPGTSELTASSWKTNPGPCTPYYARVYSVNTDVSPDPIEFKKPDGSNGPQINFQVCPPS